MKYVSNVDKSELISKTAIELKKNKEITAPVWSNFVRTGNHKQKPPVDADWWYARTASIMVKLLNLGPIGVSKLRTKYGGKKRRGHKPAEFRKASGNILRTILQQLEKAGLAKQIEKGVHKGRILTPEGHALLNQVAKKLEKPAKKPMKQTETKKPKAEDKEDKAAEDKAEKTKEEAKDAEKPKVEAKKEKTKDAEKPKAEAKADKPKVADKEEIPKEEAKADKPEEKTDKPKEETKADKPKDK